MLSAEDARELKKFLNIFLLGQLIGLPTLHSILQKFGIGSNNHQINYKKLCKKLTINEISKIYATIFETQILNVLQKMSEKDSSCWSRELVTAVLDDSIFKQWLNTQDLKKNEKDFEDCFGKFFSGQFMSTVYGFKIVTFALCIDGVLYPLYFDFVKKAVKDSPAPDKSTKVAQGLVKKWGLFLEKVKKKGITLPKIHFSCDSGYNDVALSETCLNNNLIYISVPKKSHLFEIDKPKGGVKQTNLTDWITDTFLKAEKKHEKAEKALSKADKTPFTYRFKAKYCAQNREVTLLAFRLNGSKKVSIIYSTDKNIFAKTLRRHWFQRTYIEQFFKLLKHVLQIQEARTSTKNDFESKLWRFSFIALQAQKIVQFLRKRIKNFDKYGFISIQRILNDDPDIINLLQSYLTVKY